MWNRAKRRCAVVFGSAPLLVASWSSNAEAGNDVQFGGLHLGYGIGASAAQTNGGLRHGLDVAFLPVFYVTDKGGGSQGFGSTEGLVLGPSALIGFGDTPNYVALDAGWGGSTIVGVFAGGGPVYRFKSDEMAQGYGFEGRLAMDFVLLDAGLRVMTVFGEHSSEFLGTLFVGFGRF
jgi:hypothetical protein